jgi:hypothetical protein
MKGALTDEAVRPVQTQAKRPDTLSAAASPRNAAHSKPLPNGTARYRFVSCAETPKVRRCRRPVRHGAAIRCPESRRIVHKRFKKSIESRGPWRGLAKKYTVRLLRRMLCGQRRAALRPPAPVLAAPRALGAPHAPTSLALHRPLGAFGHRFRRYVAGALRRSSHWRTLRRDPANRRPTRRRRESG